MQRYAMPIAIAGMLLAACSSYSPAPRVTSRTVVTTSPTASFVLSAEHVAIIHAYYGSAPRGRGRGNGGLPPGLAKNLARGKALPPGIAKQHLPSDLLARLPATPTGFEYVVMAGKLLLVEAATQVVRQVLLESVFG
jgi:hypothetical protein